MSEKLKPCPFCGETPGEGRHVADASQGDKWGSVVCSCCAQGPEVRTGYKTADHWGAAADAAWNKRAKTSQDAEVEALRAFHFWFRDRCEGLFEQFGMPAIDLYNEAAKAGRLAAADSENMNFAAPNLRQPSVTP
jgi:transcription elongation factor Elf1